MCIRDRDESGLAHFLEHMVFKGSRKLQAGEFMVELTYPETAKRSRKVKLGGRLGQARETIGIPYKFTTGVHVLPEKMPFEFKPSPIPGR